MASQKPSSALNSFRQNVNSDVLFCSCVGRKMQKLWDTVRVRSTRAEQRGKTFTWSHMIRLKLGLRNEILGLKHLLFAQALRLNIALDAQASFAARGTRKKEWQTSVQVHFDSAHAPNQISRIRRNKAYLVEICRKICYARFETARVGLNQILARAARVIGLQDLHLILKIE